MNVTAEINEVEAKLTIVNINKNKSYLINKIAKTLVRFLKKTRERTPIKLEI